MALPPRKEQMSTSPCSKPNNVAGYKGAMTAGKVMTRMDLPEMRMCNVLPPCRHCIAWYRLMALSSSPAKTTPPMRLQSLFIKPIHQHKSPNMVTAFR
jgi:hypothetical protein